MEERSENCNRANEEENSKEQGRAEMLRQGKRARIKRDQEREEEQEAMEATPRRIIQNTEISKFMFPRESGGYFLSFLFRLCNMTCAN